MIEKVTAQQEIPTVEIVGTSLETAAENIRKYSRSQAELWQQLPYLALQAEGNSGYSHHGGKLYTYGVMHIVGDTEGLFGTFVDCENGNLLSLAGKLDVGHFADDKDVIEAWFSHKALDAQKHLDLYRSRAVEPHLGTPFKSEEEVREWRHQKVMDLGLKSRFRRDVELVTVIT